MEEEDHLLRQAIHPIEYCLKGLGLDLLAVNSCYHEDVIMEHKRVEKCNEEKRCYCLSEEEEARYCFMKR